MATKSATGERIGRVGQRGQVVIPRAILEPLSIRQGDFVAITRKPNGVLIRAKRLVADDVVLSPDEAKLVRRGEKQLKRGDSTPWAVVKNALSR